MVVAFIPIVPLAARGTALGARQTKQAQAAGEKDTVETARVTSKIATLLKPVRPALWPGRTRL